MYGVTTRSVAKNKDSSKITNRHKRNKIEKPKIYIPIKNTDVRKCYKLKILLNKSYKKKRKSIVANIKISGLLTKEKLDLRQFFCRLEEVASKLNIN